MKLRLARPEDLCELQRLRQSRPYWESVFLDEEQWRRQGLELLEQAPGQADWRVLVALEQEQPLGYVLMALHDEHGVTHQLQVKLLDFAVPSFDVLSRLVTKTVKIASAYEHEAIVVDVAADDKRTQLWLYRCGFRAEQHRAALRFPPGHRGASSPDYRLRAGREDDLPFLLETHAAYTAAYIPGGREVDLAEVELRYQLTYLSQLDLSTVWLLEEVASGAAVGYMIVQNGPPARGEPSFYLYDVAVAPAFAGRGLSRYLIGAAETMTGQQGGVLYGDGSLGSRTIASWHAQMGYRVDTLRFALHVKRM